jgi:hypothetical protein
LAILVSDSTAWFSNIAMLWWSNTYLLRRLGLDEDFHLAKGRRAGGADTRVRLEYVLGMLLPSRSNRMPRMALSSATSRLHRWSSSADCGELGQWRKCGWRLGQDLRAEVLSACFEEGLQRTCARMQGARLGNCGPWTVGDETARRHDERK